jgi:hypothetical protein
MRGKDLARVPQRAADHVAIQSDLFAAS